MRRFCGRIFEVKLMRAEARLLKLMEARSMDERFTRSGVFRIRAAAIGLLCSRVRLFSWYTEIFQSSETWRQLGVSSPRLMHVSTLFFCAKRVVIVAVRGQQLQQRRQAMVKNQLQRKRPLDVSAGTCLRYQIVLASTGYSHRSTKGGKPVGRT